MFKSLLSFLKTPVELPITSYDDPTPLEGHDHFLTQVGLQVVLPSAGPSAVQSWLGGMPEMPADQTWPDGHFGKMVFLAQICCSDLPKNLWGGIGPRKGWLLLFLDGSRFDKEGGISVVHVRRRGPPRHEGDELDVDFLDRLAGKLSPPNGPVFPRIPVRPVTLQKEDTDWDNSPLRPYSVGEALEVVLSLLQRMDRVPRKSAITTLNERCQDANLDIEARRNAEELCSLVKWRRSHNLHLYAKIRHLRTRLRSTDPTKPVSEVVWAEIVALAQSKQAIRQQECVQQPRAVVIRKKGNAYSPVWRAASTVGEWRQQEREMLKFLRGNAFHGFNFVRDPFKTLKAQAEERGGLDARDRRYIYEKLRDGVWDRRFKRNSEAMDKAMKEVRRSCIDKPDDAAIDPVALEKFLAVSRDTILYKPQYTIIHPEDPGKHKDVKALRTLMPEVTTEGIQHTRGTQILIGSIKRVQISNYFATGSVPDHTAFNWLKDMPGKYGFVIGGLPAYGWENLDNLTISAYAPVEFRKEWQKEEFLGIDADADQEALLFQLPSNSVLGCIWGDGYAGLIKMPRSEIASGRFRRAAFALTN